MCDIYFTLPSGKEPTDNVRKGEGPSQKNLEDDWINRPPPTFKTGQSELFPIRGDWW